MGDCDRCRGHWCLPSGVEGVVLLVRCEWKEALGQWTGRTLGEGCRVGLREGTIGYWVRYVGLLLLLSWLPLALRPNKTRGGGERERGRGGGGGGVYRLLNVLLASEICIHPFPPECLKISIDWRHMTELLLKHTRPFSSHCIHCFPQNWREAFVF